MHGICLRVRQAFLKESLVLIAHYCKMANKRPVEISADEIREVMETVHRIVEDNFCAKEHVPKEIYELLQSLSVCSCQHPFPTLVMLLGCTGGATNGASTELWNATPSPLSSGAWYVGDAQQGKSRLVAYIAGILNGIDEHVALVVKKTLDDLQLTDGEKKPEPRAPSPAAPAIPGKAAEAEDLAKGIQDALGDMVEPEKKRRYRAGTEAFPKPAGMFPAALEPELRTELEILRQKAAAAPRRERPLGVSPF